MRLKIKILVFVIAFFGAFINFNVTKQSKTILSEKVNMTMFSLGTTAQAGCERTSSGGNGYCTWGSGDGGYCALNYVIFDCTR